MVDRASELHSEYIRNHELEHQNTTALSYDTLQTLAPDLSCPICFPPPRTSPRTFLRTPFGRFWNWYSNTYFAQTYSSKTTNNFIFLTITRDPSSIRTSIRDIIFSCRYTQVLENPREVALAILNRYTTLTNLPHIDFSYQTIFDLYLDTDYTFGQEEPERFEQYFGNLGSPIPEQGTSYSFVPDSHQTPIRNLDTTFNNPDPSLIPYEDETSNRYYQPPQDIHRTSSIQEIAIDINSESQETSSEASVETAQDILDNTSTFHLEEPSRDLVPFQPPSVIYPHIQRIPIIRTPSPEEDMTTNQALAAAATAMTDLATALTPGGEKTLLQVEFYRGDGTQDPVEWLEEFERAAITNNWSAARQISLAPAYLKGVAQEWFTSLAAAPTVFKDATHANRSFYHLFKERFMTPRQKVTWQKQLFDIKQGSDNVDTYVNKFKKLQARVDPTAVFPPTFITQLFIQGLRPEYAVNVQASEPANLATAITTARRWETGKLLASPTTDADQAIKQLTDQIAQLSINLAQKTPIPNSVHYAETPTTASRIRQPPTCHYCGRVGHFVAQCRTKRLR